MNFAKIMLVTQLLTDFFSFVFILLTIYLKDSATRIVGGVAILVFFRANVSAELYRGNG
jgi:hypothetical protein